MLKDLFTSKILIFHNFKYQLKICNLQLQHGIAEVALITPHRIFLNSYSAAATGNDIKINNAKELSCPLWSFTVGVKISQWNTQKKKVQQNWILLIKLPDDD